jgi:hypothetical protein
MNWTWRLQKADGSTVDPPTEFAGELSFQSQADAESWVGETWRDLAAAGVDAVVLYEGEEKIYGPMSLHSADKA